MRFSLTVSAVLAMAASVLAADPTADFDPVSKPEKNEVVNAGSTFDITWEAIAKYAGETISIELIGGATQGTQTSKGNVAAGVKNSANKFSWKVDSSLGEDKVYGLVLRSEKNPAVFQYSFPFQIKGTGNKPSGSQTGSQTGSETATTVVVTKSHGVKTVSLSTTSVPVTTSSAVPTTSSKIQNTTTTQKTTTLVTLSSSAPVTVTSAPAVSTTAPASPSQTAGATVARAGAFSVIAGVVVALFVF